MAWLTSLLKRPATSDDERESSAQDLPGTDDNGAQPPAAGGPQLAILAPDIAGISSFGLRFFADVATATAEIEQLSPEVRRGTHAFWALHDEPILPPDGHREALVLIRANLTSGVVYAVSFIDMESAWSFARFEAKRGLDISHLIILWAAFVTVREELDGVSVLPAVAPATRAQHARTSPSVSTVELEATETVREYERREEPTISDSATAPEAPAAPDEAKLAEAEAERRAEAGRRAEAEEAARRAEADRRAEAEDAARLARQAQEELREARAAADAARALAEAETTRRLEAERRLEEQQQAAEAAARSRALADMESRGESALNRSETLIDDALDDGDEPAARGTIFAHAAATETEEDTETVDIPAHLRRADGSGDPADDLPKSPELDEFDIAYEVARLLENRRWDKREEPFQGFDSPPGKF